MKAIRPIKRIISIVLACTLLALALPSYALAQTLTICAPTEHYFGEVERAFALTQFTAMHPDVSVEVLVCSSSALGAYPQADVYLMDSFFTVPRQVLAWDRALALDALVPQALPLFALEQCRDAQGTLRAVPVYLSLPMQHVHEELLSFLTQPVYPEAILEDPEFVPPVFEATFTPETFTDYAQIFAFLEALSTFWQEAAALGADPSLWEQTSLWDARLAVAQQIRLVGETAGYDDARIADVLQNVKALYQAGFLREDAEYMLCGSHPGMLMDWFYPRQALPVYLPLANLAPDLPTPIKPILAVIDAQSENVQTALDFIGCCVSLEQQLVLPTSGGVRTDVWQQLEAEITRNPQLKEDWGNPLSADEYEIYRRLLEQGEFCASTNSADLRALNILMAYAREELTLVQAIAELERG